MATTAVQALWRIANARPDQFMKEMLIRYIRDPLVGALGCGTSAAFWAGSAIFCLTALVMN